MTLDHQDDVGIQLGKLAEAQNDLKKLSEQLKVKSKELHHWVGEVAECKLDMKIKKEEIATLKMLIRAEGSHL